MISENENREAYQTKQVKWTKICLKD